MARPAELAGRKLADLDARFRTDIGRSQSAQRGIGDTATTFFAAEANFRLDASSPPHAASGERFFRRLAIDRALDQIAARKRTAADMTCNRPVGRQAPESWLAAHPKARASAFGREEIATCLRSPSDGAANLLGIGERRRGTLTTIRIRHRKNRHHLCARSRKGRHRRPRSEAADATAREIDPTPSELRRIDDVVEPALFLASFGSTPHRPIYCRESWVVHAIAIS